MEPEVVAALIGVLAGLVAGGVGAWIAGWHQAKNSRDEWTREAQKTAYAKLALALNHSASDLDKLQEAFAEVSLVGSKGVRGAASELRTVCFTNPALFSSEPVPDDDPWRGRYIEATEAFMNAARRDLGFPPWTVKDEIERARKSRPDAPGLA